MTVALTNAKLFDGEGWHDGGVVIREGRVAEVTEAPDPQAIDLGGAILAPGFVDVQVNGGGGVMFNSDRSVEGLRTIAAAHRRSGTTTLLPTLITDTTEVMQEAAAAIRRALDAGIPGIRGVHFEGPCLSPARPGVHRPDYFRAYAEVADIYLSGGMGQVHVTLAPERVTTADIAALASAGVIVSAGHTDASYDQLGDAIKAGLRGFTHLYNAMSPMTNRDPGVVGAALDSAETWCGLIADGFHLHDVTARNAIRAKAEGRMMLVTDAMGTVGATDKRFTLYGQQITAHGGRCALPDGTLAGSDLDMAAAVRYAHHKLGQPLEEALRMASLYPATFLRMVDRIGRIAPGYEADLVQLDPETLTVQATWIGGDREEVSP